MKVRLYDNNTVELNLNLNTFQDRVAYIDDKIFSNKKYKNYYDTNSQRWIGVKVVNKPYPTQHIRSVLDFLTGYIVGAKDYSAKKDINKFFKLVEIKSHATKPMTFDEQIEFDKLKNNVLYYKSGINNIIFYINRNAERDMQKALERLQSLGYKDYTIQFAISDLQNRLEVCEQTKKSCRQIIKNLQKSQEKKEKLLTLVKNYSIMIDKMKRNTKLLKIISIINEVQQLDKDIKYNNNLIVQLYDDYFMATEFIYKF